MTRSSRATTNFDFLITDDTDNSKVYETHNGRELKIDVGPRGLWSVTSTSGGKPCAPCNSLYTTFKLAEQAVKAYLRDTAK